MSAWTSGNYPLYLLKQFSGDIDTTTDTITAHLTASAPSTAHDELADISEIATGGGYTQGTGLNVTVSSAAMDGNIFKVTLSGTVGFTATGTVAAFRYVPLCFSGVAGDPLFVYLDLGETVNLANGHILAIDVDTVEIFAVSFS